MRHKQKYKYVIRWFPKDFNLEKYQFSFYFAKNPNAIANSEFIVIILWDNIIKFMLMDIKYHNAFDNYYQMIESDSIQLEAKKLDYEITFLLNLLLIGRMDFYQGI